MWLIFFLKVLAWSEVMGNGDIDYKTGLPPQPTLAWTLISKDERIRLIKIYKNFLNTNAPCQK